LLGDEAKILRNLPFDYDLSSDFFSLFIPNDATSLLSDLVDANSVVITFWGFIF
jgi:hypothetical protein